VKLLADENILVGVVEWLRQNGHDVFSVRESMRGEEDERILQFAEQDGRLIVTDDKDFGELVFNRGLNSHGVVLARLHAVTLAERIARLTAIWPVVEEHSPGTFIVVTDQNVRVRPIGRP
jgi:predicted nuclease of predicted toxin-antitoxin system